MLRSILAALMLTSCAAHEVHVGLRGASAELIRRGEIATAEQMLRTSAEETERELAAIYLLLSQAAEAKGDSAQADFWARKSLALAKFRVERGNALPLPADLPSERLP
jgi:hypothetical protein